MTRRIVLVVLGVLVAFGVAVPGVASAAVYGHTCWAGNRVCGSVVQNALDQPIVGGGAVHNSTGRVCITGIALYVDGSRIDSTLRQFPNGVCAPSGGNSVVEVSSGGYQPCEYRARNYQTHVTYLISGQSTTQSTPAVPLHGSGACGTG